jgi:hypothetical protein
MKLIYYVAFIKGIENAIEDKIFMGYEDAARNAELIGKNFITGPYVYASLTLTESDEEVLEEIPKERLRYMAHKALCLYQKDYLMKG